MKLKTKFQDEDFELGEIVEGVIVECLGKHEEELRVIATAAKGGQHAFYYSSIKKFMDEWEDAPEEPKGYWHIDSDGELIYESSDDGCEFDNDCKVIGNYFETKEEAEKAVDKLKAWKRLRDKGFEIESYSIDIGDNYYKTGQIMLNLNNVMNREWDEYDRVEEIKNELDLLFRR